MASTEKIWKINIIEKDGFFHQCSLQFESKHIYSLHLKPLHINKNTKRSKNTIYFFLRPSDRKAELIKLNLAIPKPFKSTLKKEKISFCKVNIGGFNSRTKCLETVPADIEINTDESSLRSINIYPYSPIPNNKESYAIVLKVFNPNKSGLFQFHSYGQPKGKLLSSYLGSSTIVID